jgi:hypothetical protein
MVDVGHKWIAAEAYMLTDEQAARVAAGADPLVVGGERTPKRQLFCASCNREWPATDTAGVCCPPAENRAARRARRKAAR